MTTKLTCLVVLSAAPGGVSAKCFVEAFSLCTPACVMHIATPGGKQPEYVDQDEASFRWLQDFRTKPFSTPLCLETIDGSRYDALLLPSAQGAMIDLASSQSLARIIRHFVSEQKPLCAVSHGVAALCCAVDEEKSWAFSGYSITGPTVLELVRRADFSTMQLIVEDFARDAGAVFSASQSGVVHVVVDRHVVTGQNEQSTLTAVQNLVLLCGMRK